MYLHHNFLEVIKLKVVPTLMYIKSTVFNGTPKTEKNPFAARHPQRALSCEIADPCDLNHAYINLN